MDNKKTLQETGLNKYEAASYLFLAESGVSDANTVSEYANVPLGKIYETLASLKARGLIEVQDSRPKKYRAVPPEKAFKGLYEQKRKESEKELLRYAETIQMLEKSIKEGKNAKEPETFWTLLREDIDRIAALKDVISECKREFCFLMPARVIKRRENVEELAPRIVTHLFKKIRPEVRVRVIFPEKEFISRKKPVPDDVDISQAEARVLSADNGYYIVDDALVMIPVFDPSEENSVFGIIKIYDPHYACRLKKRFEETWKRALPIDLGKELGRGVKEIKGDPKMSCYMRHLSDIMDELGIENNKETRRMIDLQIRTILKKQGVNCPGVWKDVKEIIHDPGQKKKLVAELKKMQV